MRSICYSEEILWCFHQSHHIFLSLHFCLLLVAVLLLLGGIHLLIRYQFHYVTVFLEYGIQYVFQLYLFYILPICFFLSTPLNLTFFTAVLCQSFAFSGWLPVFYVQGLQFSFGMPSTPYPLLRCSIRTSSSNDRCCSRFLIRQGKVIFLMRIFGGNFERYQSFADNFGRAFLRFRSLASYFLPSFRLFPIRAKAFEFAISISKSPPSVFGFHWWLHLNFSPTLISSP